ncbi:MAG: hypothetical protein MZV70_66925 [Desulfobacterales bacterium]|nr:hypothetical protein [Desulfobacterales bacterium]
MDDSATTLASLEYPGRLIVIGAPPRGGTAVILYAITGRSPSSQARKLVRRDGGIWVEPTDEATLKQGNVDLLVYPAVLFGRDGFGRVQRTADGRRARPPRFRSRSGGGPGRGPGDLGLRARCPHLHAAHQRLSCRRGRRAERGPAGAFGPELAELLRSRPAGGGGRLVSTYEGPNARPAPRLQRRAPLRRRRRLDGRRDRRGDLPEPRPRAVGERISASPSPACPSGPDIPRGPTSTSSTGTKGHDRMSKPERTARSQYLTKVREDFPDTLQLGEDAFVKRFPMRYGENPGYPAAFYQEAGASGPNMGHLEILQEGTKGLSYINVGDMDLGQRLARKLIQVFPGRHACVIIKHEMPSGVALGDDPVGTFEKAWTCDALSNFGGVDVFSYRRHRAAGPAPRREPAQRRGRLRPRLRARGPRRSWPRARSCASSGWARRSTRRPIDNGLEVKRVAGGLLVQKRFDSKIVSAGRRWTSSRSGSRTTGGGPGGPRSTGRWPASPGPTRWSSGPADKTHGIGSRPAQPHRLRRGRHPALPPRLRPRGLRPGLGRLHAFPRRRRAGRPGTASRPSSIPLGSVKDQEVIDKANELGIWP